MLEGIFKSVRRDIIILLLVSILGCVVSSTYYMASCVIQKTRAVMNNLGTQTMTDTKDAFIPNIYDISNIRNNKLLGGYLGITYSLSEKTQLLQARDEYNVSNRTIEVGDNIYRLCNAESLIEQKEKQEKNTKYVTDPYNVVTIDNIDVVESSDTINIKMNLKSKLPVNINSMEFTAIVHSNSQIYFSKDVEYSSSIENYGEFEEEFTCYGVTNKDIEGLNVTIVNLAVQ